MLTCYRPRERTASPRRSKHHESGAESPFPDTPTLSHNEDIMDICILDFETFWSSTHSLSKMNPIAYVMHPETEIISLAVKFVRNGTPGETQVLFGENVIKDFCANTDWSDTMVVAHNNEGFDAMLCAWRLGIKPKMWGCTLAMARPHHAKEAGGSLAKLVAHYGLGVKDQTALMNTKGRHLKDFTPEEIEAMGEYNRADAEQCWGLFKKLLPKTAKDELRLIDMTIRMLVEPQFEVDTALLETTLSTERVRKNAVLLDLATMVGAYQPGMSDEEAATAAAKTLGSAQKFSRLLRDLDVEVPMKTSPTTGNPAPALAKTDEAFLALQRHPDPIVAAAASARLGVKSTLLETRIEAFLDAARATDGRLPVPLKYYGADTTGRWSGWAYNPQNLPRVGKKAKPSDALRNCIRAPKGHKIVVADLSGIELRVNHFLWKVPSSMALFQADPEKADLYKDFASNLYNKPLEDVTEDERQVGKVAHLGLGFGAGAATFRKVAKLMAGIDLSEGECINIVNLWREEYRQIAEGWRTCHDNLVLMGGNQEGYPIDPWGMCVPGNGGIRTPKGFIRYPSLRQEIGDDGKKEWWYGEGRHKARIYAGKITENIVQHLARCALADHALAVRQQTGCNPALMVHDELVYIAPEAEAQALLDAVQTTMRTPLTWWPELVTWSKGGLADVYGAAK